MVWHENLLPYLVLQHPVAAGRSVITARDPARRHARRPRLT
jgi:hypothetical protein